MRSLFLIAFGAGLLALLTNCGEPLNLGDQPSRNPTPTLVSGMVLYFDASFVDGNYGAPGTPCGETTWVDLSGNGNDGTLSGFSCSASSGWAGTGILSDPYRLVVDGASGQIDTQLDVQPSAMAETTWEGWIRPRELNRGSRQTIFSSDDGGFDRTLLIELSTDRLSAFVGSTAPNVFLGPSLIQDAWYHVAVTYTATDVHIYLNGKKYSFGQAPAGMGTTNFLTLGSNPGAGEVFNGDIAYLTVYDRALSDAEILKRCEDLVSRFSGVVCDDN